MFSRTLLGLGFVVASVLCVGSAASPVSSSTRTLHPNELWGAVGGATNRCRLAISGCPATGLTCSRHTTESECVNGENSWDYTYHGVNRYGCAYDPSPFFECSSAGSNLCGTYRSCLWNDEEGVCATSTTVMTQTSTPVTCTGDLCTW